MTRTWSKSALHYGVMAVVLVALEFGLVLIGVRDLGRELTSTDWLVIASCVCLPNAAALLFILIPKAFSPHRPGRHKTTLPKALPTHGTSESMWDRDLDVY